MNIFEQSSRLKLRFKTKRGELATEDLWGLSIASLDLVGKRVKLDLRDLHDSMITHTIKTVETHELKLNIVMYIIKDKQRSKTPSITKSEVEEEEEIL